MNERVHRIIAVAGRLVAIIATAAAVAGLTGCEDEAAVETSRRGDALSPSEFLGSAGEGGFPPVASPWRFRFPADHGSHVRYRTEWWHLAGVLTGQQGQRFGVQFSVARIGLTPGPPNHPSRWAATDVYAGRFSLSGSGLQGLRTYQRVSRGSMQLAGAQIRPVRVWVEDWRLEQTGAADPALNLALRVAAADLDVKLELRSTKQLVDSSNISGQQTGRPPFVFYIQPRLDAEGVVSIKDQRNQVSGIVSMEHAWGELPLPGGPVARDRFTLHLDGGRELFCIRTHRVDGSGTPSTNCLLVGREGTPVSLSGNQVALDPLDYWETETGSARYPIRWALQIPSHDVELEILPHSADQAGADWTPSWAGPVRLLLASEKPGGHGFVQLTGYDES